MIDNFLVGGGIAFDKVVILLAEWHVDCFWDDAYGFEALEGEVGVVGGPLIELPKLKATWLIYTRWISTPEAVWSGLREQLELIEYDFLREGGLAVVDVEGFLGGPGAGEVVEVVEDGFVAIDEIVVHFDVDVWGVIVSGKTEAGAYCACVPETQAVVEVSLEFWNCKVDLVGEQSGDHETRENRKLSFKVRLKLYIPIGGLIWGLLKLPTSSEDGTGSDNAPVVVVISEKALLLAGSREVADQILSDSSSMRWLNQLLHCCLVRCIYSHLAVRGT